MKEPPRRAEAPGQERITVQIGKPPQLEIQQAKEPPPVEQLNIPAKPLAHLVVGSIMQAGMVVARAEDQKAESAAMGRALHRLLDGLRPAAARGRAAGSRRRGAR